MLKKTILTLTATFFALSLLASAPAPAPTLPVAETPSPAVEECLGEAPALAVDAIGADSMTQLFRFPFPLPHCGDFCTEDPRSACIANWGGATQKRTCSCINNVLVCD